MLTPVKDSKLLFFFFSLNYEGVSISVLWFLYQHHPAHGYVAVVFVEFPIM